MNAKQACRDSVVALAPRSATAVIPLADAAHATILDLLDSDEMREAVGFAPCILGSKTVTNCGRGRQHPGCVLAAIRAKLQEET